MLFYIFLFLGTWKGVLGKDDICRESRYQACPLPDGWSFPKTESDLEQICPGFIQTIDCMKEHLQNCNPEDNLRRRYLQNLGDVTKDACDKDSQLHLRIVQNIDCFNEVVQNDSKICYKGIDKKTGEMMKHIQKTEAEKGINNELWESFQCVLSSFEVLCYATKSSERCGSDAENLVLELNRRSGYAHHCQSASGESLAELLALFELEHEDEASLKRIMGRE